MLENKELSIQDSDFILKHSFDIKDLIETGDIVKVNLYGEEIIEEIIEGYDDEGLCIGLVEHSPAYLPLNEMIINSIVTKEQFDATEYKVYKDIQKKGTKQKS